MSVFKTKAVAIAHLIELKVFKNYWLSAKLQIIGFQRDFGRLPLIKSGLSVLKAYKTYNKHETVSLLLNIVKFKLCYNLFLRCIQLT